MQQHAPRGITIVIAVVLVVIGIAGTTVGVGAYVLATIVMLAGIFIRGL